MEYSLQQLPHNLDADRTSRTKERLDNDQQHRNHSSIRCLSHALSGMSDSPSQTISKGTVLSTYKPYHLVPFFRDDDTPLDFPNWKSDPVALPPLASLQVKDPQVVEFVNQLINDGSDEALCTLMTIELVLCKKADFGDELNASKNHCNMEDTFSIEAWPMFQDQISWPSYCAIYHHVNQYFHRLTLPHPMADYAQTTLLQMDDDAYSKVLLRLRDAKLIPAYESRPNRLWTSQQLLDHVTTLPSRDVGLVLVERTICQSPIPTCLLELKRQVVDQRQEIICEVVALYDMQSNEKWTVSTRSKSKNKRSNKDTNETTSTNSWDVFATQRCAHTRFAAQDYANAMALYKECHDWCCKERTSSLEASPSLLELEADLWYSMAAVELAQNQFVQSQRRIQKGGAIPFEYQKVHMGIRLQLEKQMAYRYFEANEIITVENPERNYQCLLDDRLFITPQCVDGPTCQKLIEWANEYVQEHGWTTNRHYAVPTQDVPIHQVPKLLNWFVCWMETIVSPLLVRQFGTARYYVHDAFLVQYTGDSKHRFLPLHLDESTHSLVLALNNGFEGGGTYFYDLDRVVSPPVGSLVSFYGNQLWHGGSLVTDGHRYILAVFLYQGDDDEENQNASKRQKVEWKETTKETGFTFGFF